MRRVDRQLKDHDEVVRVWFNAWTSERGDTLEGLIKSVLSELDPNILRRKARNKKFITGVRVITTLAAGVLRSSSVVDALWDRASVDPKARNQLRDLLDETMTEWLEKTPKGSHSRLLVVFVDDLDRCEPDNVFQVFEAIKLYLDATGFVFVIGFDETIISEAILEQKKFSKAVTSQLYLDKIVQIEYAVPSPSEAAVRAFLDRLAAMSNTAALVDESARTLIVQGSDGNPRRLKRFINAFVLEHALEPEAAGVNPEFLIRELILRTYFQDFVRLYGRGADPLEEFNTYLRVRNLLLGPNGDSEEMSNEDARRFFVEHRAPVPAGGDVSAADLPALEQNLPEPYPRLAQDENFVNLVADLQAYAGTETTRSRLESAPEVGRVTVDTTNVGSSRVVGSSAVASAAGLRILWVDDNPAENKTLVEVLSREGSDVELVESGDEAEARLKSGPPVDVVISDIPRHGREDAGLADLANWKANHLYEGPAIFFAARITPARRKQASSLGARVTNDANELLSWVRAYAPAQDVNAKIR
jgi:CheY-like chemotaxis protein